MAAMVVLVGLRRRRRRGRGRRGVPRRRRLTTDARPATRAATTRSPRRSARRPCSTSPSACATTASTCPTRSSTATAGAWAARSASAATTGLDQEDFEAAQTACEDLLEDVRGSFGMDDPEQRAKMQEQMLAFAQCMRDHGIDMPDPQFNDGRRGDDPGAARVAAHRP